MYKLKMPMDWRPGLKQGDSQSLTECTCGCRAGMSGAESMDAKLIEDPAEEYEAGDGGARESRVAASAGPD